MTDHNATFAAFFDLGKDILSAAVNKVTNVILCQIGNSVDATPDSDSAELWGPPGYYAIPANPTPGQPSCQCITLKQSDHDVIIGTRDTRDSQIYGNLKAGERCIAGGFPSQGRVLIKANGAVVAYTTSDNTTSGSSVSSYVGPDKIQLANQFGSITIDSNGITMAVGGSGLTMTPAGIVKLTGQQVAVQGAIVGVAGQIATCLGTLAAPTPGVPGPTSVVVGPIGSTGKGSQTVFCSP